jgi:hypothetical protein
MELIPHHAIQDFDNIPRKVGDMVKVRRRTVVVGTLVRIARVRSEKIITYKQDNKTRHDTEGLITRRSQANQARQKFSQRDIIDPEASRAKITANWTRELYIVTSVLSDERVQDDRDAQHTSDNLHKASFRYKLAEVDTTDRNLWRDEYTLKFTPSEIFDQLISDNPPRWVKTTLKWCYYRSDLLPIWPDDRTNSVLIIKSAGGVGTTMLDDEGNLIMESETLTKTLANLIAKLPNTSTRAAGSAALQTVLDQMTEQSKTLRAFVDGDEVRVTSITSTSDGNLRALVKETGDADPYEVLLDEVLVLPKTRIF